MDNIAGIPYRQIEFNKNGASTDEVSLPPNVTDLFVVSHGWNNNEAEAQALYQGIFESFIAVAPPGGSSGRQFAIVGIIWPSKQFDELVASSADGAAGAGAAGMGTDANAAASVQAVSDKLDQMKQFFGDPTQVRALEMAKSLLPDLEEKGSARQAFVSTIRSILDRSAANNEDASNSFFSSDGNDLMKRLKIADDDLDDQLTPGQGGGASLGVRPAGSTGGAAGLSDILHGFKAAAMNILNFTTYYEMKRRAGVVGQNGVAPLVDQLASQVQRVHLVGHSFGGRLVTAVAATSKTDKIFSMTLLQAAFSHNGFSKVMNGFFRSVVDNQRVKGPILITNTKNDKAVGIAYPLASRIAGDVAAALGDENDKYGGMGRNGAQKMEPNEVVPGQLLAVGGQYAFAPAKIFNLKADQFISGHSDVKGKEVGYALRSAVS